jgi:hypothetical protein
MVGYIKYMNTNIEMSAFYLYSLNFFAFVKLRILNNNKENNPNIKGDAAINPLERAFLLINESTNQ